MTDIQKALDNQERRILLQSLGDCRFKLASSLGNSYLGTPDETRLKCNELFDMDHESRADFILDYWSADHLQTVDILLTQLRSIEDALIKLDSGEELE